LLFGPELGDRVRDGIVYPDAHRRAGVGRARELHRKSVDPEREAHPPVSLRIRQLAEPLLEEGPSGLADVPLLSLIHI